MNIGKNIKKLRTQHGLTQKDLAEKLNVTPQAVSRWELDTVEPSLDTIKDMTKLFDVTMDELMSDEDIEVVEEKEPEEVAPIKPVVGVCSVCGKEVHADDAEQRVDRGGHVTWTCNECVEMKKEKHKQEQTASFKKRFNCGWIFSSLTAVALLVIGLIVTFTVDTGLSIGALIAITIVAAILGFTTMYCIILRNNFIGELWLEIATWGCVKLPGLIFTLSFDGIVWLILTKIFLAILSFTLVVLSILLATAVAAALSVFVFPFAVYWAYNKPEKSYD